MILLIFITYFALFTIINFIIGGLISTFQIKEWSWEWHPFIVCEIIILIGAILLTNLTLVLLN